MAQRLSTPLPIEQPRADTGFLLSEDADPPVTVVREIRVRPGNEPAFEEIMARLMAQAVKQRGHLGATVIRPQMPGQAYRFIYKFDRRSSLEEWHGSALRAELVAPIAPLIEWDRFDRYPGLETWFSIPKAETAGTPPKWKTTLMSWFAIFPLVLAGSYAMKWLGFTAPMPVQVFVLTAVVVPLVAYVVAPQMGRLLHGWLHAGVDCR